MTGSSGQLSSLSWAGHIAYYVSCRKVQPCIWHIRSSFLFTQSVWVWTVHIYLNVRISIFFGNSLLYFTQNFFSPSSKSMTHTTFPSVPVLYFVQFPVNYQQAASVGTGWLVQGSLKYSQWAFLNITNLSFFILAPFSSAPILCFEMN